MRFGLVSIGSVLCRVVYSVGITKAERIRYSDYHQ